MTLRVLLRALAWAGAACSAAAQTPAVHEEIPLERCDKLPVARVRIDNADFRFLVDTGATTFLDLRSFSKGRSSRIQVSSYSGTGTTSARQVTVPELALGPHRLRDLRLPAIDLAPIGEACGGRIDGILGVDLLEKLGATIDLQRRVARFAGVDTPPRETEEDLRRHHMLAEASCTDAFNRADVAALEACLDPEVVLFTPWGESRGRKAMVDYVRERYFSLTPRPRMDMKIRSQRILGNVAWYDYDYSITLPQGRIEGRGTGVCRRHAGRWLLLSMHNSRIEPDPVAAKP